MSSFYKNFLNLNSNKSGTTKNMDRGRKSTSLPVSICITVGDVQEMKQLISEHGSGVVS